MRHLLVILAFMGFLSSCTSSGNEPRSFRFHLFQEPGHLDPALSRASSASYLFYNTRRGLYRFDVHQGLISEEGKCKWINPLKLSCKISPQAFWSDGAPVKSDDYIRSFRHLLKPETASPRASLLSSVLNYTDIHGAKKPIETLGVYKVDDKKFTVQFSKKDPEFIYKLTSTALYPRRSDKSVSIDNYINYLSNGPYILAKWTSGKELKLIPNPYYKKGHPLRPSLKIYFIDNEMTAYRLYQNGRLDFLRRLPSNMITKMKSRNDFYQMPVARYDYIGFGQKLLDQPLLRKAMSLAIDYDEFKVLLQALGRPGCPSIPPQWMDRTPCYSLDLNEAKKILSKIPQELLQKSFKLKVSQMGGLDIKKQAEFLQSQWRKNLGLNIEIDQVEQKAYLNELRSKTPDIFRKGVGIDRPTCLSALETFASDGQQNYMKIKDRKYDELLNQLAIANDKTKKKSLCRQGVEYLMNKNLIIPLGEIHFSILAQPKYEGWSINSLNQLDLSQLHPIQ